MLKNKKKKKSAAIVSNKQIWVWLDWRKGIEIEISVIHSPFFFTPKNKALTLEDDPPSFLLQLPAALPRGFPAHLDVLKEPKQALPEHTGVVELFLLMEFYRNLVQFLKYFWVLQILKLLLFSSPFQE